MNALLLVDIQNDFLPGGALAVPDGDQVVPVANRLMRMDCFDLVVATQDWHPPGHKSFASQHPGHEIGEVIQWQGLDQILWPDHCVQDTPGAAFAPSLDLSGVDEITRKGTDTDIDSYSGFFDNAHRRATGLDNLLKNRDIDAINLAGLATDYCVKFTALDAVDLGYRVTVIRDGCRAVNLQPEDEERALVEMQAAGVRIIESGELGT